MNRIYKHVAALATFLDRFFILIPEAPSVGDMAESMPVIPEASYDFRVHKATYVAQPKTAGAKGPYIKVQHVVTGPNTPEAQKSLGRMVFQNYSLTGDGSFRLRELLVVTGHDENFQLTDSDQLLGLEFSASVIIKEEKGYAPKNEIKKHYVLGQAPQVVAPQTV